MHRNPDERRFVPAPGDGRARAVRWRGHALQFRPQGQGCERDELGRRLGRAEQAEIEHVRQLVQHDAEELRSEAATASGPAKVGQAGNDRFRVDHHRRSAAPPAAQPFQRRPQDQVQVARRVTRRSVGGPQFRRQFRVQHNVQRRASHVRRDRAAERFGLGDESPHLAPSQTPLPATARRDHIARWRSCSRPAWASR